MNSQFTFNAGQRKGIVGLILMIFIFSGVIYWFKKQPTPTLKSPEDLAKEKQVQHFIDSLKAVEKEAANQPKIYPFNPNFITDYKGYRLGMSVEEIDRLVAFRKKDQWVNSVAEFQEVTQVSDSLLNAISPYFKFPEWVKESQQKKVNQQNVVLKDEEKADLNKVSADELQEINGIGEVLSKRITRYRAQIHGFADDIQLKDIYGLKYEVRQKILERYSVKSESDFEKLDINKASVAELTEIPYFDYELARKIVNYRLTHEGIKDFEELSKIDKFPYGRVDRVKLYLKIE